MNDWRTFDPGLDQPLPDPVPRQHAALDTGAMVPPGWALLFEDVDALLEQRASWVPAGKPKRYAPTVSPGYGG